MTIPKKTVAKKAFSSEVQTMNNPPMLLIIYRKILHLIPAA